MGTYTTEEINQMWQTLKAEGWEFDLWSPRGFKGWWLKRGDTRLAHRRGDPKPFNLAVLAAWELRAYVQEV